MRRPDGTEVWFDSVSPESVSPDSVSDIVLLLPPGGRNAAVWPAAFCQALLDAGTRVARIDLRGQGRTQLADATSATSVEDLVDDALAVCGSLTVQRAVPRVHLVGAGLGGVVAAMMALRGVPGLDTVSLVATSGWYLDPTLPGVSEPAIVGVVRHERDDPARHRRSIRREVGLLAGGGPGTTAVSDGELDAWFTHGLRPSDGHRGVLLRARPLWAELRTLAVPTLVVHGRRDPLIPAAHGVRLAETIPTAALVIVDEAGHHLDPTLLAPVVGYLEARLSALAAVGWQSICRAQGSSSPSSSS